MSIQVRTGGWWLSTIAGFGDLTWSHQADGGCEEASFTLDAPATFTHSALVRNAIVEIRTGPWPLWKGFISDASYDDSATQWTYTASGLSAQAQDALCLDGSGNATTVPDTAFDQAVARAGATMPWLRSASISSTAFVSGDSPPDIEFLGDLLNAYADSVGKRWGLDGTGTVYMRSDPTTPTWYMVPGTGRFGLADDNYASDLYVRYLASGSGYQTVTVGDPVARSQFGRKEQPVDATPLGLLNSTQATAVGNGLLAKGAARQAYTNGVSASKYQLTTAGGSPAYLPYVVAGDLVRMFGVLNEQGQPLPYVDWVIGETSYDAGTDTIGLTPVGLADRTLTDVLSLTGSAA